MHTLLKKMKAKTIQCRPSGHFSVPQAASYNAFLQISDGAIPKNAGCLPPIKVLVQSDSLLNVEFPLGWALWRAAHQKKS